jgi:type III restriction enzyme
MFGSRSLSGSLPKNEEDEECAAVYQAAELVQVGTPVGPYNPDWGLVMEEVFGDDGRLLYLVRETKSTTVADAPRAAENQNPLRGKTHVGALGVDYRVVTSADDLP